MNHLSLCLLGAGLGVLSVTRPALAAPTAHDCATASEDASSLQKQEKLLAAKDRFLVCADAACPAEIRDECARRVTEVTDATPSVVFEVKDAAGNDVSAVRVTMDGTLLVDHLGASAIPIDPGEHTFHFDGADPTQAVEKKFVVRDGEKNRHLAVTMGGAPPPVAAPPPAPAPAPPPATPDQAPQSTWSGQKTAAVVAAGVGIIGIGVGAAFGVMTLSGYSNSKNECGSGCSSSSTAESDWNNANTSATISDIGFIAGGVLVAGAAVLWFTAPSGAHVQVTPAAGPQGAGFSLRGTF
jgi:hypothetical protein